MARSALLSRVQHLFSVAAFARRHGITDVTEARERHEAAAKEARAKGGGFTRRDVLKGLAASAAVATVGGATGCAPTGGRVVVIGGGIAGLHCAYRLFNAGVDVTVYEARDRVGGRMWTARGEFADDQVCELGGELIDTNHATLWDLAEELGITLDDRFAGLPMSTPLEVFFTGGARVTEATIIEQMMAVQEVMAETLDAAESDDAAFETIDATSLADWLDENVPPASYAELHAILTSAYRGEYGLETAEQSVLNLLYLLDFETVEPFRIFGDSDERYHVNGGNDLYTQKLAEPLGERVVLETRLLALRDREGGGYVLRFVDGTGLNFEETADHVVLALPFSTLREVELSNLTLSDEKRDIIENIGYGTNAKVMGGFSQPVWRSVHGSTGSLTTDLGVQQTWDSSVGQGGASAILTNFLGGAQGVASLRGSADHWFRDTALPDLERVWPGISAAYTGTAVRMHWPTVPTHKGSYTCYRPGQWAYWSLEGKREGNLHFCGEHCSLEFQGWMEGAAETGGLVAAEILDDVGLAADGATQGLVAEARALGHPAYHGDKLPRLRFRARRRAQRRLYARAA